jgi:hypothetical protein
MAVTSLLLFAGAGFMLGQTSAGQTITAREIAILDKDGRVTAKISAPPLSNIGGLQFTDSSGKQMASLTRIGDSTGFSVNSPGDLSNPSKNGGFGVNVTPTLTTATVFHGSSNTQFWSTDDAATVLVGGKNESDLRVAVQPSEPSLQKEATPEQFQEWLKAAMGRSILDQKTAVHLNATPTGARVLLTDEPGFEAALGNSDLESSRTGTTSRTSAASLMLFGKDRHVLWKAP